MKKVAIAIVVALSLGFAFTSGATDLSIGDGYYVGLIHPGEPASEAWETAYISNLIGMTVNTDKTISTTIHMKTETNTYYRSGLDDLVALGSSYLKDETKNLQIDDFNGGYIYGKYDGPNAGAYVWLVGAGDWTLPATAPGTKHNGDTYYPGLSHYSTWGTYSTAEPGSLMLLGFGLIGVTGVARRKIKK